MFVSRVSVVMLDDKEYGICVKLIFMDKRVAGCSITGIALIIDFITITILVKSSSGFDSFAG